MLVRSGLLWWAASIRPSVRPSTRPSGRLPHRGVSLQQSLYVFVLGSFKDAEAVRRFPVFVSTLRSRREGGREGRTWILNMLSGCIKSSSQCDAGYSAWSCVCVGGAVEVSSRDVNLLPRVSGSSRHRDTWQKAKGWGGKPQRSWIWLCAQNRKILSCDKVLPATCEGASLGSDTRNRAEVNHDLNTENTPSAKSLNIMACG